MRKAQPRLPDRIGRALRAQFDEILHEPLPNRWVDLINYLNDKEKRRREALQRKPGSELSN